MHTGRANPVFLRITDAKGTKMSRMFPDEAVKWLGVKEGKLCNCPKDMKNCVCSFDSERFEVPPLKIQGEGAIEIAQTDTFC